MTDERQLFFQLLDLDDDAARRALLDEIGRGNPAARDRLLALLEAHDEAGDFLKGGCEPLGKVAARTAVESPLAEGPGSVIDRYRLLQKIGEGGFGVVYMAEQREPVKRRVALKIIKPGMDTRQVVGRFETERQALAMMDHPNIAKVLDGGTTANGRPFFVMELVRGHPITEFCDQNNLDTGERLQLFIQVCGALQHAHQKGIIHRDIKPGNVLVTMHDDRPVPKVIDFGIAKAMQRELTEITVFTRFQEFIGTPAYMSPEQAQFSGLDIDTRTDIYSLGVLLYELLTGRTPFDARELLTAGYDEMRRRIREVQPLKPSTRVNTLAAEERTNVARRRRERPDQLSRMLKGELDWIVMQALEKDRARRYDSAGALARDVERFLDDEPVNAAAPGVFYRVRKFTARHRFAMGAAAVIFLLLISSIAATSYLMVRASDAELQALRSLNQERQKAVALEIAEGQRARALERAEREAAVSAAVVQFLNEDLFAEATQSVSGQDGLTMKELVQRAQGRIDERFAKEPLVGAAVRQTLATTLFTLGDEAGAMEQAEAAFQVRKEQLGANARDTLESMMLYAYLVSYKRDWQTGRELAEDAVRRATDTLGRSHPVTLEGMSRLARIYYGHTNTKAACRKLSAEVVELARSTPDVEPNTFIRALQIHGRMNNPGNGEESFREAVAYAVEKLGRNNPRTIAARGALAGYLYDLSINLEEAGLLCRGAMLDYSRLFDITHPNSLIFRDNLRLILRKAEKWEDAVYQGMKILQIGGGFGARLDMLRLDLARSPLPEFAKTTAAGKIDWVASTAATGRESGDLAFDDSAWSRELPSGTPDFWLRGRFELTAVGGAIPVFVLPPRGEFIVRVNGVRANRTPPHRDAVQQILVTGERGLRALRVGKNVFGIEARQTDTAQPFQVKVLALSDLGDEAASNSRLVESP